LTTITINDKDFELDTESLSGADALRVEAVFGDTLGAWSDAYGQRSFNAARSLVLVLVQKQDASIHMHDIDALAAVAVVRAAYPKTKPGTPAQEGAQAEPENPTTAD
jgi:hypothetical protein